MTIRQYVERRAMAIRYLAFLYIVTMFIAVFGFPDRFANVEAWQVACYWIPMFLLYSILAATTKCPRCLANWGQLMWNKANPFSSELPDQCPHCGVSFAERLDGRSKII
jgi:hypothetical protein